MVMIIQRSISRLNIFGAAWRSKLTEILKSLGYKSSEADYNVWIKCNFTPNGYPCYKCMIFYVDDLFHICFNPKEDMDALNIIYWLKEGFGTPDQYIGANVEKVKLKDGQVVWSTNFVDYLKIAIGNVYNSLGVDKTALKNYGDGHRPYSSRFRT